MSKSDDLNQQTPKPITNELDTNINPLQHVDTTTNEQIQEVASPQEDMQQLVGKFRVIADGILNNYKEDRGQIEETIQFLSGMVQMGPKTPRVYIEMLVSALRAKAETNTNAIKLLDAMAKLLSASKGTAVFMQQTTNSTIELAKLLETPLFPDELD